MSTARGEVRLRDITKTGRLSQAAAVVAVGNLLILGVSLSRTTTAVHPSILLSNALAVLTCVVIVDRELREVTA